MLDPQLAGALSQIFLDLHVTEEEQQYWALPQNRDWLVQSVRNIKKKSPHNGPPIRREGEQVSTAEIGPSTR